MTAPGSRREALALTLDSVSRMGWRQIASRIARRLRTRVVYPRWARVLHAPPAPLAEPESTAYPFDELAPGSGDDHEPLATARDLAAGRFDLLGLPAVDLGSPVRWQHSPGPDQRLWQYTLHYGEWALDLARAHALRPTEGFLDALLRLLDDWIEHNPVAQEPAWEPYPVSRRLIAWSRLCFAVAPEPRWRDFRRARLEPSLRQQATFLVRNLEHDTPNNHLVANHRALAWCALSFPHWPESRRWRSLGLRGSWREMERQILSDGVHDERSISYHTQVLQDLFETWCLARSRGIEIPPEVEPRLLAMLRFLAATKTPGGTWPMVNDSVPGYPVDPREILWAASGRVEGWAWAPEEHAEVAPTIRRWLGEVPSDPDAEPWSPQPGLALFPQAGYAVLRDRHGGYLFFDAGPMGPPTIPGHAHADPLAVELHAGGQPLLVDPGAETYAAGPRRDELRSTTAHSTVTVDGQDPCRFWGPFRVARPYAARLLDSSAHHVEGEHLGYAELAEPVVHRRRIEWVEAGHWLIRDLFEGSGAHDFVARFQLAPGARVEGAGAPGGEAASLVTVARWAGGTTLTLRQLAPLAGSEIRVATGHIATGWNRTLPAPRLEIAWRAAIPCECLFLLEVNSR